MTQKLMRWMFGRSRDRRDAEQNPIATKQQDLPILVPSTTKLPELTQDALMDMFKQCDLYTRCRIRRVSRRWKEVVSTSEVNEIVLTDFRCIYVSHKPPVPAATTSPENSLPHLASIASTSASVVPDIKSHPKLVIGSCFSPFLEEKHPNLDDHKRNGLLGAHVTVFIYHGGHELQELGEHSVTGLNAIHSIGMFCSGVKRIVCWNLYGLAFGSLIRRTRFQLAPPSELPTPQNLTIFRSHIMLGFATMDPLKIRIKEWSDCDEPYDDVMKQFLKFSPEHLQWLARHAKHLPTWVHQKCIDGMPFLRTENLEADIFPSVNLETETFTGELDRRLIWYLTLLILQSNLSLPFELTDYASLA